MFCYIFICFVFGQPEEFIRSKRQNNELLGKQYTNLEYYYVHTKIIRPKYTS